MRLGRLILQLCAFFIAGAILFAGYAWYRDGQVETFIRAPKNASSLRALLQHWAQAPAMTCASQASGFSAAERRLSWHYNGKSRFDTVRLSEASRRSHLVLDADNLYAWQDGAREIVHLTGDYSVQDVGIEFADEILFDGLCEVWWNPDESVFRVPANLPLITL
jgi:hypothetical protein